MQKTTLNTEKNPNKKFAYGVDIGWLTQMEERGIRWADPDGKTREPLQILKDFGVNAVRLRLFVDPADDGLFHKPDGTTCLLGRCDTESVLAIAHRAADLGMRLMLDLHYSDNFADPGIQWIPKGWADLDDDALVKQVYDYTKGVMERFSQEGLQPEWVQTGNEINHGIMHPRADFETHAEMLVRCFNSGADAVHAVFPDTRVICHVAGLGREDFSDPLLELFFARKTAHADVIGFSFYPYWNGKVKHTFRWYLNHYREKYGLPVMIVETGEADDQPEDARRLLWQEMKALHSVPDGDGLGLFYWEPEACRDALPDGYQLGACRLRKKEQDPDQQNGQDADQNGVQDRKILQFTDALYAYRDDKSRDARSAKKILMLTDGWRRFVTYAWTIGIMHYVHENHRDIALCQYNTWGNWNQDQAFNRGQYALFELPDFNDYDAVFVDVTNIQDAKVKEKLLDRVRASGLPACSVCYETPGIAYVGVDGYAAIQEITAHLVEKHGCSSFHFAGGPKDQYENNIRSRAFRDCMRKYDIPEKKFRISTGDFTADCGKKVVREYFIYKSGDNGKDRDEIEKEERAAGGSESSNGAMPAVNRNAAGSRNNDGRFLKAGDSDKKGREIPIKPLPDAFVCANDNIAVGIILELEEHGWHCPENVIVTGFDNLDKASFFQPQITTATLDRERIGYEAAMVLDRMMENRSCGRQIYPVPHENFVHVPVVFSESCGCANSGQVDYRAYLKWQIIDSLTQQDEELELASISADLGRMRTLEDILRVITRVYSRKNCAGVYTVIDDRLMGAENASYTKQPVLPSGKFDKAHLRLRAFFEKEDERCDGPDCPPISEGISEGQLRRHLSYRNAGQNFFCMSLHVRDTVIGYILLKDPAFITAEWRFFQLQNQILSFLVNWYSGRQLEISLKELSRIYNKDQLTGIYARTAFTKLNEKFKGWIRSGRKVAVFFADADHFKELNDEHGHDYGDRVLVQIARTISSNLSKEGFAVRYGGDEFVAACPVTGKKETEDIRFRMLEELEKKEIEVSIGSMTAGGDTEEGQELDSCIRLADQAMYEIKEQHHKESK
ncbi:MAG: glycosyl hydrolase 53 family protein [Eubacterium sp.]|nr:glycosyl hydrolase 53 family protein [Eubacterium sp.]